MGAWPDTLPVAATESGRSVTGDRVLQADGQVLDALVHALAGPFPEHSQGQVGEEERTAGQQAGCALGSIDHPAQLLRAIRLDAHAISPWVAERTAVNRLPTSAQFATFHQAAT